MQNQFFKGLGIADRLKRDRSDFCRITDKRAPQTVRLMREVIADNGEYLVACTIIRHGLPR